MAKEDGKTYLADVLTKPLRQASKESLCDRFMYCDDREAKVHHMSLVGYLLGMSESMWPNPGRCIVWSDPSNGEPHAGLEGTE